MKQTLMAAMVLVLALFYLSWRNNGHLDSQRAERDRKLEMLENVFSGGKPQDNSTNAKAADPGDGQPVSREAYQPCLDSFVTVMDAYGITADNPPVKNTHMPALTYPITTYESFHGSTFINWLDGVVTKYDPDGKGANIELRLQFGVCTAKFVADMNQPKSLTGRITVFVVPAYREGAAKSVAGSNPGDSGFELGGLHP